MLRPAAATWTEEAKEVPMAETSPMHSIGSIGSPRVAASSVPPKTNRKLRLFKD